MTPSDSDLLRRYVRERSEAAFSALVERHVDLVYAAALRQVRQPHLAREVSQTVFIELARRARTLGSVRVLSAWLYTVTRRRAIDMIRSESRRRSHETPPIDAAATVVLPAPSAIDWAQTAPVLDEAMQTLSEDERAAVLLRYFENKSLREVGLALGVSDDAAQKRVHRALERLRGHFTRRRLPLNAAGLAALLSGHAVAAAPAGLAATVASSAFTHATATGVATLIPAFLMPSLGKSLAISAVVLGVGYGLYERIHATGLAAELAALRARQSESDRAHTERLSSLDAEIERIRVETRAREGDAADQARDPAIAEMAAWLERRQALRAHLDNHPELAIPELQLLDESDWLDASKSPLDTPESFRRATGALRSLAEEKFGPRAQTALKAFASANAGAPPVTVAELAPWFEPPVDPAILDRWVMLSGEDPLVANMRLGAERVLTQKEFVDEDHDARRIFGPDRSGSIGPGGASRPARKDRETLERLSAAYAAAHSGAQPRTPADLLPHAATPEEQQSIRRQIDRQASASKPRTPDPLSAAAVAYVSAHPGTPEKKAALQQLHVLSAKAVDGH